MHLGSLESTQKLELLSAAPRATLTLLSCSPNFPCASITRYTHAKHEPILNLPPFSLIRDFGKQNTRGNVSKISVSLACY